MTLPETISADYTLRPSELADVLALLVEARQPTMVWGPPVFLPPSDDPGLWLINLEELPSAVPMVQAALYQLMLERKCGEYELPEGASLPARPPPGNPRRTAMAAAPEISPIRPKTATARTSTATPKVTPRMA